MHHGAGHRLDLLFSVLTVGHHGIDDLLLIGMDLPVVDLSRQGRRGAAAAAHCRADADTHQVLDQFALVGGQRPRQLRRRRAKGTVQRGAATHTSDQCAGHGVRDRLVDAAIAPTVHAGLSCVGIGLASVLLRGIQILPCAVVSWVVTPLSLELAPMPMRRLMPPAFCGLPSTIVGSKFFRSLN
jgi:hypothetical protein